MGLGSLYNIRGYLNFARPTEKYRISDASKGVPGINESRRRCLFGGSTPLDSPEIPETPEQIYRIVRKHQHVDLNN